MHDIGKNLVKIMMEGSGIEVVDLGVDVAPQKFVEAALHQNCGIIACSSLLTTTMQEMRHVVASGGGDGHPRDQGEDPGGRRPYQPELLRRDRRRCLHRGRGFGGPRGGLHAPQRAVRV